MTNRALLVGLDVYPNPANNLDSCVKDTYAFRELLNGYDFTDSDVKFLHNADANLANVRDGLDWLFDGAEPGDRRVFFESSHGYRYLKDGVMTEVLCLYDEFLEDTELSRRTRAIPEGVLTVVLDACHSGGMDKMFVADGMTQIARTKVFHASPEMEQQKAFEVNSRADSMAAVKFFGRASTAIASVASKNFANDLTVEPMAKDGGEPEVELNAVLLTACRADETAAAGSSATDGLSAFTFALTEQSDIASITVSALCDKATRRLQDLSMRQTPTVFAPSDQQYLLSDTFISEQPVTESTDWWGELFGTAEETAGADKSGAFDLSAGSTLTETKEYTEMTTTAPSIHTAIESVLGSIAKNAGGAPTTNGAAPTGKDLTYLNDVAACAANLVPAVATASRNSKAPVVRPALSDPARLQDKSFWDDVVGVANTVVHVAGPILSAIPKEIVTQGSGQAGQGLARQIAPERLHNKDFWSSAFGALETIVPHLIDAAAGKDYNKDLALTVPPEYAQDKGWFDDVMSVVQVAAPIVLAAL
ncbi:caspase family protein [Streptomyces sp. NPDC005538]|uniref:caspase family protein n=1 Tax=unclassified Streptomyces TaxID=2593676 RepID=UPI0033B216E6